MCGVAGGISQPSGTAALLLALRTLNVGVGDEVVVPTYVCRSVMDAVLATGAVPRFADVSEAGLLTVSTAQKVFTTRTKALIAVHLFGAACDVEGLKSLGQPVIEDACQAVGLRVDGRMAGSIGDVGVLSFHATKVMTTGEGGMLLSSSETLVERARAIANHSQSSVTPLADLQAALGLSQLRRLESMLYRRVEIADSYDEVVDGKSVAEVPQNRSNCVFRYILRVPSGFASAETHFLAHGVCVRKGVDTLLHRLAGETDARYPNASRLFTTNVSIPIYPALTDSEVDRIMQALRSM